MEDILKSDCQNSQFQSSSGNSKLSSTASAQSSLVNSKFAHSSVLNESNTLFIAPENDDRLIIIVRRKKNNMKGRRYRLEVKQRKRKK